MSLSNVMHQLRSVLVEWDGFLFNPRFYKTDYEVTFPRSGNISRPEHVTLMYLEDLVRNNSYSLQAEDGSIFQLWYLFDHTKRNLYKASLSFYKHEPEFSIEEETMDSDYEDENIEFADPEKLIEEYENIEARELSWFRIDYDPELSRSVVHGECHLHIGMYPHTRISIKGVPSPRQFIEAVIAWFYPQIYRDRLLDSNGNHADRERSKTINELSLMRSGLYDDFAIMHMGVPDT